MTAADLRAKLDEISERAHPTNDSMRNALAAIDALLDLLEDVVTWIEENERPAIDGEPT